MEVDGKLPIRLPPANDALTSVEANRPVGNDLVFSDICGTGVLEYFAIGENCLVETSDTAQDDPVENAVIRANLFDSLDEIVSRLEPREN